VEKRGGGKLGSGHVPDFVVIGVVSAGPPFPLVARCGPENIGYTAGWRMLTLDEH
jgi:hypothetical protein